MNDLERDLRQMFEQHEADLREPRFAPAHAPMPVLRRTRRRQVGVALMALAVIAGVAIGSTVGATALLRASDRKMPADQGPTSSPSPDEAGRSSDLADQYSTVLAQGEVDGVSWVIWGNADGVACGFANDAGGIDAGCGHDQRPNGTDLSQIGECIYACPTPGEPIVYGRVSSRATSVRLVLDEGTMLDGVIHPAPPELPSDVRFFTITTDRPRGLSGTLVAIGPDAGVLEQLRYPWLVDQPGGPSVPVNVEATLASGAPTIEYDGRPYEPERWEVAVWRNEALDWCLGTIYPNTSKAVVATEGRACGPRERLFDGIRSGPIGHADVWWMNVLDTIQEPLAPGLSESAQEQFLYRTWGTVSADVAAVRIEVADGSIVEARLYDPPPGLEDMGRLFVVEFRSKLAPLEWGSGMTGITWRASALGANGEALGSDEIGL